MRRTVTSNKKSGYSGFELAKNRKNDKVHAYERKRSPETWLVLVVNCILVTRASKRVVILVILNVNAIFLSENK